MIVSSHKSENSIKSYAAKCPERKKKEMFDALAQPFADSPPIPMQEIQNKNPPKPVTQRQDEYSTVGPVANEPYFDIVNLFPNMEDEEDLNDNNLLAAIEKIESENSQLQAPTPRSTVSNTINSNYIQNVNRSMLTPHMFYPHSNVTINYNFNNK